MAQKKDTKKPAAGRKAAGASTSKAKSATKSHAKAAAKAKPKAPAKAAAAPKPPVPAPRAPRPKAPDAADAPRKAASATAVVDHRPAALGVHDLRPSPGSTHYRKRLGRGPGSGHGKTAGRGNKGQKSRSGYRHQRGFEGGQMPLHRRVPKRGFTNIFRVEYDIVNLSDLDRFEAGQAVTPETLHGARLARKTRRIKILGDGEIGKALTVSAHKFSASAQAKIEAAGGRCEVIER
jgi:large subunit ribosomal protein L15